MVIQTSRRIKWLNPKIWHIHGLKLIITAIKPKVFGKFGCNTITYLYLRHFDSVIWLKNGWKSCVLIKSKDMTHLGSKTYLYSIHGKFDYNTISHLNLGHLKMVKTVENEVLQTQCFSQTSTNLVLFGATKLFLFI